MVFDRYEIIFEPKSEMFEVFKFSRNTSPGMVAPRVAMCHKDEVIKFVLDNSIIPNQ